MSKIQAMHFKSWSHFLLRAIIDVCLLWILSRFIPLFQTTMVCKSTTKTCVQNSNHQLTHLFDWLKLVLNLNCFDFDDNYYQQVGGVAMGTKMGPTMRACSLVSSREKCLKDIKEESRTCINNLVPTLSLLFLPCRRGKRPCSQLVT